MEWIRTNKVTALFVVLCIGAFFASKTSLSFLLGELFTRIGRNSFLVLSLIIPVVCGLGLNFGIVIGAMAAQISIFLISVWELTGLLSMLVCVLLSIPIAVLFGFLAGKMFNSMKGSEMIGGMVLRYMSDGLYQLLFLFIFGGVITINSNRLMIAGGVGVKNTIDLKDSLKYVLDELPLINVIPIILAVVAIWQVYLLVTAKRLDRQDQVKRYIANIVGCGVLFGCTYIPPIERVLMRTSWDLFTVVTVICFAGLAYLLVSTLYNRILNNRQPDIKQLAIRVAILVVAYGLTYVDAIYRLLLSVKVPVFTFSLIGVLCLFNQALLKTRLGQNMRTVGNSMVVASSSGIDVEKTRIIAVIISTVTAALGQLISLQNIGTFQTYGSHDTVGQFAIASLLVGGASVQRATNGQGILGVILFHTLFILSPIAGKELFGNAAIGEYFRVFIAYGVIALSLAMHAMKSVPKEKIKLTATPPSAPGGDGGGGDGDSGSEAA